MGDLYRWTFFLSTLMDRDDSKNIVRRELQCRDAGGLNENGPPGVALFESIKRYSFGGSVSLGLCFEVSNSQARPRDSLSLFLLPMNLSIGLSAFSPSPCPPECCCSSCYGSNVLNTLNCKQPPLLRVAVLRVSSQQQNTD